MKFFAFILLVSLTAGALAGPKSENFQDITELIKDCGNYSNVC